MFTCIITGSNNSNLLRHTLSFLIEFNVKRIVVVTKQPCLPCIQQEFQTFDILFSKNSFINKNEAYNFALQYIPAGRVLFLESGAIPTKSSIEFHRNAEKSQVICGLYTRIYDFDANYKSIPPLNKLYKAEDARLHISDLSKAPWMLYSNNNSSMDVDGVHRIQGFDASFCIDGVTENADLGYSLYNLGYNFVTSDEAQIETYTLLENSQLSVGRLKTLYIWFTDHCNYKCKMCRIGQNAYSITAYREPSFEEITKIILRASEIGISKIELFGGEMLMRKDLFSVIEFCTLHRIEIGFVTNASLITEEIANRLFQLGVKDIPVSLDAPVIELNDWIRGTNAWSKTMKGINNLKKFNNTFSIFNVVMKQNFQYMSDMVRLAKEIGAESISYQPISSRQAGKGYSNFSLDYSDVPELKKEILIAFKTAERLNIPIRSQLMVKTIPEYVLRDEQLILYKGCTLPLSEALITKTNKLQLCFTAYGPKDLYRKADGSNFTSVWESASYQKLQTMALTGQCPGCLANCSDLDYLFKS